MSKKGNFYVVAAPSGAGKTSLVRALVNSLENIKLSISYTTRPPRSSDIEGVDYHFVNEEKFQKMISNQQFLEYAIVYDYHYGTSREWVLKELNKGIDVLLEIDWQGARQIRQQFSQTISIFILPPSMKVLYERLNKRNRDNVAIIRDRMEHARSEITHYHEFDYLIVNDDFNSALQDLTHIVKTQRLRCSSQEYHLVSLLAELLGKK